MIHVNDKCYRHEHEPMLPVIDEETRLLVNRQQQSLTITSGDQQWLKNNKTSIVITYVTSSDQRLWECVRRRLNFFTDTVNDFPSWLSTPKTNLFSSTTGVLQKDISVTKSMPVWWLKTALRDGASFRRLTSLIGLKNLHQLSNFVLNIVTLTWNV